MPEGILPICKPKSQTAFSLVSILRRLTQIRTIGHAGTLDPFAEGVMVLLIGKRYTALSNQFLHQDKAYRAQIHLGITTDSYDTEGQITAQNPHVPTLTDVENALLKFQGTSLQTPPMFSAKKVNGKKLYELARKGITIEREAVPVTLHIQLLDYTYPHIELDVQCSKGTYIRSLAYDIGTELSCGAHLSALTRTRSGNISLEECCDGRQLLEPGYDWIRFLKKRGAPTQPMLLITDIAEAPSLDTPCGLTIGSFDGVHLGHQSLLKHLRKSSPLKAPLSSLPFLTTLPSTSHLTSYPPHLPPLQKAKLLGDYGADIVILTPFTQQFATLSFDLFLRTLLEKFPFSLLILGTGATFGKNKGEGNEENIRQIAPELGFTVEYLSKLTLQGAPISSGRIRTLIFSGSLRRGRRMSRPSLFPPRHS